MTNREETTEISIDDLVTKLKVWGAYLTSKWLLIFSFVFLGALTGILYAALKKPVYHAEITFAPENDEGARMGMYAGIAAQFGLDLGGGGGGVFEGDNLVEFLKSKMLIRKALLSETRGKAPGKYLIDYYIQVHEINKGWEKDPRFANISFETSLERSNRLIDSIINNIVSDVSQKLVVEKVNKLVSIIVARVSDNDELSAKLIVEQLVTNGIQYYVDYRSKKTKENVAILERQTDSVRSLLRGNIVDIAATSDLNVNPTRQIVRTGIQRKQLDAQVNGALYQELVKNLELSKLTLRKETPLIQIIDTPTLPLEKNKMGRLKGALIFSVIAGVLVVMFLVLIKIYKDSSRPQVKLELTQRMLRADDKV